MTPTCIRCGRPTADGYACMAETTRAAEQLRQVVDMVPAARDVAHGLSRHGGAGASGKPGSRLPIDLTAMSKLDAVQNELVGWARATVEERHGGRLAHAHEDPIIHAAQYLIANLEWWRHRANIDEILGDVEACARVVRGIARGPSEQRYLGPCGATVTWDDGGNEVPRDAPCEGDVYAHTGATNGTCGACKARWLVTNRAAWIEEQTADLAAPARDIAYALGVSVKTIRSWATEIQAPNGTVIRKAKLRTYYRVDQHVVPWIEPDAKLSEAERKAELAVRGPRLHYVGDVRDLAREAAVRRAENEAKRARDNATREDAA